MLDFMVFVFVLSTGHQQHVSHHACVRRSQVLLAKVISIPETNKSDCCIPNKKI